MELYYYANPLSPSSGMQSQLPILLAEYTFRSQQDITDYLVLLDQTDSYFEGITNYLMDQSSYGLFMPDFSVDKVIQQCDEIMSASLLEEQTHFLHTTFEERLELESYYSNHYSLKLDIKIFFKKKHHSTI